MDVRSSEVSVVQFGDVVRITQGPFAGLEGQLRATGQRALVAIELSGRQVDIEMDLDWVSTAAPERMTISGIDEHEFKRRNTA